MPRTAPPNVRPNRRLSSDGPELTRYTHNGYGETLRQVGWHGQTGDFYALGEEVSQYEPGSIGPLYAIVDCEPIVNGEPAHPLLLAQARLQREVLLECAQVRTLSAPETLLLAAVNTVVDVLDKGLRVNRPGTVTTPRAEDGASGLQPQPASDVES